MNAVGFCPTETITMPTSVGGRDIPAERHGELLVIQMPRRGGGYFADRCTVVYARASAGVACFSDIKVARNFANELNETFDLRRIWFRHSSGEQGLFADLMGYVRQRAQHPSFVAEDIWSGREDEVTYL